MSPLGEGMLGTAGEAAVRLCSSAFRDSRLRMVSRVEVHGASLRASLGWD